MKRGFPLIKHIVIHTMKCNHDENYCNVIKFLLGTVMSGRSDTNTFSNCGIVVCSLFTTDNWKGDFLLLSTLFSNIREMKPDQS